MSKYIIDHPRAIIIAVLLVTAFFAFGLRRGLVLDVSPLGFVERGSQARADYESARKNFGSDDYLVVAVVCDDVFSPPALEGLRALHGKIERQNGVAEVLSLINVPYAHSINGVVEVESLIPSSTESDRQLSEARAVATTDRLYAGNLVSSDSRTAAFNILFKPDLPTVKLHETTGQIYQLTREAGFKASYFAGDPFSQWRGTKAIKSDLQLFLPLTLLLIALLLWLCFRSFVAVALPLMTIGLGLIWLMGLMAFFKAHFTILALMLPTLMLAIGCSYMIHVINQIGIAGSRSNDQRSAILEAMRFINVPVIVSALTIIAGFLSLAFTKIPAVRATAIYAASGAAFTMILSLTFIPAVLVVLKPRTWSFRVGIGGQLVRLLEGTGNWATSHQTALYILTSIIVIVSLVGMWKIKIDIDFFRFFKPTSETSIGLDEINKRLSGAVTFNLVIDGKKAGAIEEYTALARIAALQKLAEDMGGGRDESGGIGLPTISHTLSVVDFLKHLNRAFHDNDPHYYRAPTDNRVIEELLSDRDQLHGFLTRDGRMARILVRSNVSGSSEMAHIISQMEKYGRELFPDFRVYATGTIVLLNLTSDRIAREQVQSVTIALVMIFIMLSILFRSLRVGLTALIPNLIPVLFFFGFMGWRGIPLNLTTSLVASVVLGLAVDNAVQFIVRFRRVQPETVTLREAIIQSMRLSGRPIIYANIALAAAFALFAVSNFEPVASFGLLSAVTIIGCLIEDLVLLPARLTSPVFRCK